MTSCAAFPSLLAALLLAISVPAPALAEDVQVASTEVRESRSLATRPNWWRAVRDCNTKFHPWQPPGTLEEWKTEAEELKRRIQISQGLWPMPPKQPLEPVVHGKIEGDGYTVEKVFFASRPGLYVTGSLYRPAKVEGKVPGILCPHGHWPNGRFYDAGDAGAKSQLDQGAESNEVAAHHPMQARMVQLARMGCVVFHYDMIGYADQQPLEHRWEFVSATDGGWLIENMGLQTWNSIRALDFIESLPEVDPKRLAITGSSGGATQTMMMCALDDRLMAAVPAVMVSTGMQGGCTCENAPYLRIGTNNVAIAAVFAPKPLGLIGADDWTIQLMTLGYPELKHIYGLYGAPEKFEAWVHPEFKHNYNQVSRVHMYEWFNQYLGLNASVEEKPFDGLTQAQLTVFTDEHPLPKDAADGPTLRQSIIEENQQLLTQLMSSADSEEYTRVIGGAADILLGGAAPSADEVLVSLEENRGIVSRKSDGNTVPVRVVPGEGKEAVVYCNPEGVQLSDQEVNELQQRFSGKPLILVDLPGTGYNRPEPGAAAVDTRYYGYTSGYNLPLVSRQVQDLLTTVVGLKNELKFNRVVLAGAGDPAIAALLAQSLLGETVAAVDLDLSGNVLREITDVNDPLFLPGCLKYGGYAGLASVDPCAKITLHGVPDEEKNQFEPLTKRGAAVEFVSK